MGFGKHSARTYGETLVMAPSYVNWCITTADEEDDPHWRLVRFANWARNVSADKKKMLERVITKDLTWNARPRSSRVGSSMASSSQGWEVAEMETNEPETTNEDRIKALEEELQDLRRKTGETKASRK